MTASESHDDPEKREIPLPPEDDDDDDEELGPPIPPDGGWGWVVVLASLFCNIIVDGVCFSFGVFYVEFINYFKESKGKTAWVGSLIPGMYLGMGELFYQFQQLKSNKMQFCLYRIQISYIHLTNFFLQVPL